MEENNMDFYRETGAIISPNKQILHLVDGTAGLTLFPDKLAWDIHKSFPGNLFAFSHVHPPEMTELSHEDETTLKAWAIALYPYPMRMITITHKTTSYSEWFMETCYLGMMESKEMWQAKKLTNNDHTRCIRKFEIVEEWSCIHQGPFYIPRTSITELDANFFEKAQQYIPWYGDVLIKRSYK
jgi:hypothetical protein